VCGTEAPTVFYVASGEALSFSAMLRDNEALSQYKIDIHGNFDCHGHAGKTEDWTVLELVDLDGETEYQADHSLSVPEDVTAGFYHFHVQVIDKAGNESPFANFFDIRVVNMRDTVAPEVIVSTPSEPSFSANKGDNIRFVGSVADNYSLGEGDNGRLELTYSGRSSANTFVGYEIQWDEAHGADADFDFSFEIPQTLVAGTYDFILVAYDGVNNNSERLRWVVEVQ
jgi:hypothetical protein